MENAIMQDKQKQNGAWIRSINSMMVGIKWRGHIERH